MNEEEEAGEGDVPPEPRDESAASDESPETSVGSADGDATPEIPNAIEVTIAGSGGLHELVVAPQDITAGDLAREFAAQLRLPTSISYRLYSERANSMLADDAVLGDLELAPRATLRLVPWDAPLLLEEVRLDKTEKKVVPHRLRITHVGEEKGEINGSTLAKIYTLDDKKFVVPQSIMQFLTASREAEGEYRILNLTVGLFSGLFFASLPSALGPGIASESTRLAFGVCCLVSGFTTGVLCFIESRLRSRWKLRVRPIVEQLAEAEADEVPA